MNIAKYVEIIDQVNDELLTLIFKKNNNKFLFLKIFFRKKRTINL